MLVKKWLIFFFVFAVSLSFGQVVFSEERHESDLVRQLEKRKKELLVLKKGLAERKTSAQDLIQDIYRKFREFKNEIALEKKEKDIRSFDQAEANHRILGNLKLIRKIIGYISGLKKKTGILEKAILELEFQLDAVDDDIDVLRVVPEKDISQLMKQTQDTLNQFSPELKKDLVDDTGRENISLDRIWAAITRGKVDNLIELSQ